MTLPYEQVFPKSICAQDPPSRYREGDVVK